MAEHLNKNWQDLVSLDPDNRQLEATEEQLYMSAKSGSLFESDLTQEQWQEFCDAARLEEEERKLGVPKKNSSLTKEQKKLLDTGGESIKSPGVRKIIAQRDELIKRLRPQCVDADGSEFEKEMLEELGLTEEEFKAVDKSLGPLQTWDELEELNSPGGG